MDFDNEIVLQPANVVALFFPRAKDAAEAVESEDAAADEDTANTATKQTFESEDTANTAIKQTFRSMGLRCNKSVATHLDYLAGNLGRTNLRPLVGLPPFVDDIFVFGYLSREECVFQKGKLSCTSGEKGAEKVVVASIANALESNEPWGNEATCRRLLCTRSRPETREAAQYAQQLRESRKTHSTRQIENGKKSTRKKRLLGILWRNAMTLLRVDFFPFSICL